MRDITENRILRPIKNMDVHFRGKGSLPANNHRGNKLLLKSLSTLTTDDGFSAKSHGSWHKE